MTLEVTGDTADTGTVPLTHFQGHGGRFGDTGTVPLTLFYEGRSLLSRVEHKETVLIIPEPSPDDSLPTKGYFSFYSFSLISLI